MIGVLVGFLWIFVVLGIATLLEKKNLLNDEGSRKFIHIGVANWIIITAFLVDNVWLALIAPTLFVIINGLSFRFDWIKAMERDEKSVADLGTVYYAISLVIITFLMYQYDVLALGVFAILVMGYGDGLSAVMGKAFGKIKLYNNKTLIGSLTVFAATMVLGLIYLDLGPWLIGLALLATLIELLSPKGFDNLTLPVGLFLVLWSLL